MNSKSRERSGFDPHRDPYPEVATLTLGADVVEVLPVDQLGIAILRDLIDTQEWNEYNYLLYAQRAYDGKPRAAEAIAEGMAWLRVRALIARTPGNTSDAAIFVTRTGPELRLRARRSIRPSRSFRADYIP